MPNQQQINSPNVSGDEDGNNGGGSLSHTARTPPETVKFIFFKNRVIKKLISIYKKL